MPKYIQLYRDNQPLLGSDGVMKVDGRFNLSSIRQTIIDRNKRMVKNFPNSVANGYALCSSNWKPYSNVMNI